MRKELEVIKIIEQYLNGELNTEDKKRFEAQLSKSPELQKQVAKQKLVIESVQNIGTKQKIKKAKKSYSIAKATWYGVAVLAVVGVIAAGVVGYQKYYGNDSVSENIKYELNEDGTAQWVDADELITPQFFDIDMSNGDVVQTEQGMIIAIPEGAFLDKNGKPVTGVIELEVKEALDATSMMIAGLSTKSGDDLLETGGMFYVNARKDGENLTINPDNPILAEVPTDEVLGGMELYKGVRREDGSLDWQNPKPIEQFLTTVDIHTLDFYPPAYQPKLQELGYAGEDKTWKDSVYYSFGGESQKHIPVQTILHPSGVIPNRPMNIEEMEILGYGINQNHLGQDGINESEAIKLGYLKVDTIVGFNMLKDSLMSYDYYEGELRQRELNPSRVQAIWNDQFQNTLIATKEFEERMKCLHGLTQDRFLDLYVSNLDLRMSAIDSMVVESIGGFGDYKGALRGADVDYSGFQGGSMILDSLAVADSLAAAIALVTRDDYVVLDSPLEKCLPCQSCELEELKNQFIKYALQNKGRVKMDLGATKMLQEFYQKHAKIYAEAAEKVQDQFRKEYYKEKADLGQAKIDKSMQDWVRESNNLVQEIDDNLTELYKQLGLKKVRIPVSKYTVPVTNTGWNNIDRKVIEGTIARTTINVEYEGKTAEIKYEPITVTVIDELKYDKVFTYLLPKQLISFQRIKKSGTNFSEKLTEFYDYDVVVVGYIGNKIYVGIERKVSPKKYSISLHATDKSDLKAVFNTVGKAKHKVEFISDILDQQIMLKMEATVSKMEDMITFRKQVEKAIFHCNSSNDSSETVMVDTLIKN